MALRRILNKYSQQIWVPPDSAQMVGPPCLTCGRVVPREHIVEEGPRYQVVLFECHGASEAVRYDFESNDWTAAEATRMRLSTRLFDPAASLEPALFVSGVPSKSE